MTRYWRAAFVLSSFAQGATASASSSVSLDYTDPPPGLSFSNATDPGLGGGSTLTSGVRTAPSSPASLAALAGSEAYFAHEFGLGDSASEMVGFGTRLTSRSAISGSFLYSAARNFVETDDAGAPARKWNTGEFVLTMTYARKPQPWLSAGVNGKTFGLSAFGTRWMGVAFDAGAELQLEGGVRATAAIVNAGWQSSSGGTSDALRPEIAAGIGMTRSVESVAVGGQIEVRRAAAGEAEAQLVVATEARLFSILDVRIAYRPLAAYGPLAAGVGFTAGAYALDYSYAPLGAIGSLQRLGLSARFSALRRG